MACPYFEPIAPLDWRTWRAPLRPPLGSPYSGACHAAPQPVHPEPATLAEHCNMGYASGGCPHFRPGAGDAVRFSVAQGDDRPPTILWLVEADALPLLSGEVPLETLENGSAPIEGPPRLTAQLRAYAASYRASHAAEF